MERNHLQPNPNYNAAFIPNPAPNAGQQQAQAQQEPVPPLANAPGLHAHPQARNLEAYNAIRTPQGWVDSWNWQEYQPIKPEELGMEKLADEAANSKKVERFLKHAQECEADGDLQDAEKNYKKALRYTENTEHYKLYAVCLSKLSASLQDKDKANVYREKAARAFYYLGDLYQSQRAWNPAQASYKASCELALYEVPLKALVDVARQLEEARELTDALEKLADFYAGKGDIAAAIDKFNEAFEVGKAARILEKLEALHSGEGNPSKMHELAIQRFELQISQDPKNIGIYRGYARFLKDIGRHKEARAVKDRMDELLQAMQHKIVKQKNRIQFLEQQLGSLGMQVFYLDFSSQTDIQDDDLIALLNKNPYIKLLNLQGCTKITDAGLAALEGLQWLTSLNLNQCAQLTDASLQHLSGLSQLRELSLTGCRQLTDTGFQNLTGLTQLTSLSLNCCLQLTDGVLQHLSSLTQLTSLNLGWYNRFTDAVLQYLSGFTQLTSLNLSYCNCFTDAGLQHIAGLAQLTSLNLSGCQFTDAGLQYLVSLPQFKSLTSLNLENCTQFTDASLQHLAGLTQLMSLNLASCQFTDTGLQYLAGLTQLKDLNLASCQLTDTGLQYFAGLTQLTSLDLCNCYQLTDSELKHLAGLTQLTFLRLPVQISNNAKEEFKKQIPGLTIQ